MGFLYDPHSHRLPLAPLNDSLSLLGDGASEQLDDSSAGGEGTSDAICEREGGGAVVSAADCASTAVIASAGAREEQQGAWRAARQTEGEGQQSGTYELSSTV